MLPDPFCDLIAVQSRQADLQQRHVRSVIECRLLHLIYGLSGHSARHQSQLLDAAVAALSHTIAEQSRYCDCSATSLFPILPRGERILSGFPRHICWDLSHTPRYGGGGRILRSMSLRARRDVLSSMHRC